MWRVGIIRAHQARHSQVRITEPERHKRLAAYRVDLEILRLTGPQGRPLDPPPPPR